MPFEPLKKDSFRPVDNNDSFQPIDLRTVKEKLLQEGKLTKEEVYGTIREDKTPWWKTKLGSILKSSPELAQWIASGAAALPATAAIPATGGLSALAIPTAGGAARVQTRALSDLLMKGLDIPYSYNPKFEERYLPPQGFVAGAKKGVGEFAKGSSEVALAEMLGYGASKLPSAVKKAYEYAKPQYAKLNKQPTINTPENIFDGKIESLTPDVAVNRQHNILKSFYDRTIKSSKAVLNDMGPDGKKLVNTLEDFWSTSTSDAGKYKLDFAQALRKAKPTEDEFAVIVDAVEGNAPIPTDARLKTVYDVIVTQGRDLGSRAEQAGLKVKAVGGELKPFQAVKNYWRRSYDKDFFNSLKTPSRQLEVVEYLISSGQAKDKAEASGFLKQFMLQKGGRRIGEQFERQVDFPVGYSKTPLDWFEHLDRMTNRVVQAEKLGEGDANIARQLVANIKGAGYDNQIAQETVDRMLNTEVIDTVWAKINSSARAVQTVTKLGPKTSVLNYFQRYQAIPRTDVGSFMKARKLGFTNEAVDWAVRTGMVNPREFSGTNTAFQDVMRSVGKEGKITDAYLKIIGMNRTEYNNRILAANAGKFFAEKMFSRLQSNPKSELFKRALESLGINPSVALKNGLSEQDLIKASQQVVNDTQFRYGVLDLPIKWTSTTGRTVTQFKPAAYQQVKFFKDYVVKEALQGNIKPLISFLVVSQTAGEGVADIKTLLSGRSLSSRPTGLKRIAQNQFSGPGVGMLTDTIYLFTSGSPTWMTGFFTGPTVSTGVDLSTNIQTLLKTGKAAPLAKQATKEISPLLRNILFPQKEKTIKQKTFKRKKIR